MAGEFGAVLRRLREDAGLTQDELERRSGVSVSTIRGLETGKRSNPRMTTVQQLADALALRSEDREELLGAAVPGRRGGGAGTTGEAEAGAARAGEPAVAPPVVRAAPTEAAEQLARAVAARWQ
ncbi:helix-turn-helix transcriptional regulator, partial [Streptomyces olivaceoviridis]